jgi:hypothetical protein
MQEEYGRRSYTPRVGRNKASFSSSHSPGINEIEYIFQFHAFSLNFAFQMLQFAISNIFTFKFVVLLHVLF